MIANDDIWFYSTNVLPCSCIYFVKRSRYRHRSNNYIPKQGEMLAEQIFLSIIMFHLPPTKCIPLHRCSINYLETVVKLPDTEISDTIKSDVKNVKNVMPSPSVEDCVNRCGNFSECRSLTYEKNFTRCTLYRDSWENLEENLVVTGDVIVNANQTMLYADRKCIIKSKCQYDNTLLRSGVDFLIQWKGKYLNVDLGMRDIFWSKSNYTWFHYDRYGSPHYGSGGFNASVYRLSNHSDICLNWSKSKGNIGLIKCLSKPAATLSIDEYFAANEYLDEDKCTFTMKKRILEVRIRNLDF